MNFIWYLLWFLVAVSLLVTVHEFGHFWVARKLGFKVLRFSVGFGRPLYKKVAGADQIEYVIAAIPLGGYVKMLDEREGPVPPRIWRAPLPAGLPGSASSCCWRARVSTSCLRSSCCGECSGSMARLKMRPLVGEVVQGSVADRAGRALRG